MLIRREDKTIIFFIALLGAVLSVFFVSSLPGKIRAKTCKATPAQDTILQAGAMDKLKQASELSEQMDIVESVTRQLAAVEVREDSPLAKLSFVASLTGWQVAVLSIGAGALGYGIFWVTMWLGVAALYIFIRSVYWIIGKISPNCAAAQKPTFIKDGKVTYLRNPDRILPIVIKVVVLITVTMSLFVVIAWQMTSIQMCLTVIK